MYDVLYLDRASHSRVLARAVARESAVSVARQEARRRQVGRMFLAGSERLASGEAILIVETGRRAA